MNTRVYILSSLNLLDSRSQHILDHFTICRAVNILLSSHYAHVGSYIRRAIN